ncbi:glutamine synthetase family protein [Pseudolysinimonas yzui]|uniref:Glutamate--ammonia ligase n=1 Tax=Pseudolysinimonas yzui TaxID=2708254 RepID=A0A8J3GQX4_9MICO|nr:glutamine synthetase family protein [Pseudolysinimonas yzui]GHF16080.1 glutamate--ammonia ligase [Pseudolysinimonas yzui]
MTSTPTGSGNLTLEELNRLIDKREIDTVIVAFADMQGRLVGKRVAARLFREDVAEHGAEACNYLLAVDVENNTVGGYDISSWETGYGDMVLVPDFDTLRHIPWLPGSALVMADLRTPDAAPVTVSPREILKAQIARLAEKGLVPFVGTELEFIVFDDSFRAAWAKGYRELTPASDYNIDYALLASTRMEPLLRDIRLGMEGAGMYCEGVKGECNFGQQEIAFRYAEALATCDNHTIYKNGAKEIADAHGKSLTFMAKYNEREGNSCHIHLSVRGTDGSPVMADGKGMSKLMEHWIAGLLHTMREMTLFFAPNINSYKRYVEGSFAPTAVAWGMDNRTCALRVVGHGHGLRVENRVPGGDVNPYLAVAAIIAGGLYGIENSLELEPMLVGNGYTSDKPRVPATLRDAADLFAASDIARDAFGGEVVAHYLNNARIEQRAYDAAITDWERVRGFERL